MRVLLLDTGFSAAPIFDYLVSRDHEVWVMGNRPQDAIARKAGERWIEQDYGNVGEVARQAERLGIERFIPGCTDVSIATCTAIAGGDGRLDLATTNEALSDKRAFRALCANLDLPAPRAMPYERVPHAGRFICKPIDGFSGRGISVFKGSDRTAMRAALSIASSESPSGQYLIEPFIEGQLYSWSAFIEGGQVADSFFVREGSSVNPFAVDTSFVEFAMPASARESLRSAVNLIARTLDLVDGLVHLQFLWNGHTVSIVEITRRCPGDLYALLIEYATGFAYAAKFASYFLGQALTTTAVEQRAILRHTVTSAEARVFAGLALNEALALRAIFPLVVIGQVLAAGHAGRVGVLFCEATDFAARDAYYARFLARRMYEVL